MRVIWERSHCKPDGCTVTDKIPFLSVARSLGDYWSFNPRTEQYTVSPEPHVSAIPLDLLTQKFVVIASDGLWNVMTPNDVVSFINDYQSREDECHQPKDVVSSLIREALDRWSYKRLQADNIAILIAFLSEEEPEKCKTSGVQNSSSPSTTEATPLGTSSHIELDDSKDHCVPEVPRPLSPSSPPTSDIISGAPPTSTSTSNDIEVSHEPHPPSNVITELDVKIKKRKNKHRKTRLHDSERELARFEHACTCPH